MSLHRQALAASGRCGWCAEKVEGAQLLSAAPCPHCGVANPWPDAPTLQDRIARLRNRWYSRRYWVYGLVGLGCLIGGPVPLVASVVTVVGLIVARHTVLRERLVWLSPRRRVTTRILLRLWLLVVALGSFLFHELLTLLPLAGIVAKVAVGLVATAAFVEPAFALVESRMVRDSRGDTLDTWEWALPVALLLALVGIAVATTAAVVFVWQALDGAGGWLVTEVRTRLADWLQ